MPTLEEINDMLKESLGCNFRGDWKRINNKYEKTNQPDYIGKMDFLAWPKNEMGFTCAGRFLEQDGSKVEIYNTELKDEFQHYGRLYKGRTGKDVEIIIGKKPF